MPRFKEQAICIRLIDWSETSQIVALLTEGHGKLRGLAKGSRRTSPSSVARYSGGIELLTRGESVGLIRPSAEMANITEWDLQQPYRHLRTDLDAQRLGLYGADLINAMLAEHDPHPRCFAALAEYLETLGAAEQRAAALLLFQWKILEDCGYRPQLDHDAQSGEPLADRRSHLFDARAGGVIHEQHQVLHPATGPWRVRQETLQLLRQVAQGEPPDAPDRNAVAMERANRLLCVYARALMDRQLPTMEIVLGKDVINSR